MEESGKETTIRTDILATSVVKDIKKYVLAKPLPNHLLFTRYALTILYIYRTA